MNPRIHHASKTLLRLGASLLLASTGCANDGEFAGEEEEVDESQAELSTEVGEDVDPEKDADAKAARTANDAAPQVHELIASSRLRNLGTKCLRYRNKQLVICGSTYISTPPQCVEDSEKFTDAKGRRIEATTWSSSTEVKVVFSATATKPGIVVASGRVYEDRHEVKDSTDAYDEMDDSVSLVTTARGGGRVTASGRSTVFRTEARAVTGSWEGTDSVWTTQFRTRFTFNPRGPESAKTYAARAPGIAFALNSFCALAAR